MIPILALWAVPRSRSSAFTVMMMHRGDFDVIMEPFENSAYYSDDQIVRRYRARGPQYNYASTLDALLTKAERRPVFIKDHAYYIEHIADARFLAYFRHTFLIRHPGQALPSYFDKWPDVSFKETGYEDLSKVFDRVVEHTGKIPPLIDADDLMRNPAGLIKVYCRRAKIPYVPHALSWKPLNKNYGPWHDHLVTTSGFQDRPNRSYQAIEDNPRLQTLYERCLPYYKKLYQHRIRVDEPEGEIPEPPDAE